MDNDLIVQVVCSLIGGIVAVLLFQGYFWVRLRAVEYEVSASADRINRETKKRAADARWSPKIEETVEAVKQQLGQVSPAKSTTDILKMIRGRKAS